MELTTKTESASPSSRLQIHRPGRSGEPAERSQRGRGLQRCNDFRLVSRAPQIVAAYDFLKFEQIVDVGGGQGALLHEILSAYPNLRGVLIDLPSVVTGASVLRSGAIAGRCEVVGGDFFQAVPEGADAYLMRVVIHDWNDEDALRILRNCRDSDSREVAHDRIGPEAAQRVGSGKV
jgi:O-methyltransferase domain